MNVKGNFHNDAMLRQITEAVVIINPHSLSHLLQLTFKCYVLVCLFGFFSFFTFSAINSLQNLAPSCLKGPCKKYSLKRLLFWVNVGSGMNIM